jgi:hypothetical protein
MESKRKCKSDNEAKESCKVMTLDEKVKIPDKLRGSMSSCPKIPLIFYFKVKLSIDILL